MGPQNFYGPNYVPLSPNSHPGQTRKLGQQEPPTNDKAVRIDEGMNYVNQASDSETEQVQMDQMPTAYGNNPYLFTDMNQNYEVIPEESERYNKQWEDKQIQVNSKSSLPVPEEDFGNAKGTQIPSIGSFQTIRENTRGNA